MCKNVVINGVLGSFGGVFGGASDGAAYDDNGFGGENDYGTGSLEETIPGLPGEDYPIFAEVPDTSFTCDGQVEGGYYSDPEGECQVFHICGSDGNGGLTKYSFLCPNGTIFHQQYFVCDWWFNVDCSLAESLYSLNDEIAAERDAYSAEGQTAGGQNGGQGIEEVVVQSARARDRSPASRGQEERVGGQPEKRPAARGQNRNRGQSAGGQQQYGGQRNAPRGQTTNTRGQTAGAPRRNGGSTRVKGNSRGYLAPGAGDAAGDQPSYGGAPPAGDFNQIIAADVGYGAPDFEGAGDFPLLNEYTRNTRGSKTDESEDGIVAVDVEELMDKTA